MLRPAGACAAGQGVAAAAVESPIQVATSSDVYFASYRLDARAQVLWQDDRLVRLTPKAFGVLHYLARHADRIVTKHELLDHVWPEVHVGDAVLKVAVREIRQALDDDPDAPRFVQTSRRVGYRFVASVSMEGAREPRTPSTAPAPVHAARRT